MDTIGADIVLKTLLEEGVDVIFGYPGANTLPLNDRMADSPIRHYLMRHEQAAAHAADGYARATGKVGVCLATSGPGATNLVTGIATAYMDSTPMVAITAQVNSDLWGRDAFQETDIIGITMPITKHSFMIRDANQIASSLRQAFQLASTGRTGPVLVDIPKDILSARCSEQPKKAPKALQKRIENREQMERIAQALNRSERPVILIGGGVKLGDACTQMSEFVQKAQVPFVTTMMGIGSVASANGFNLGFIGTHGNELANRMIHQSDFILALGARFTERSTSVIDEFAPLATVAQIDIDPTSIGKNVKVDIPFVGDIQEALAALIPLIVPKERDAWLERIRTDRQTLEEKLTDGGCGQAGTLIRKIQAAMPRETIVVPDVGLNQIWTVRTWQTHSPRSLLTSGGMGTMGFSLPAAIGARVGAPDREVVVICGDGGFYMNIQELATISSYGLPIKVVVINNGHLGMIRQIQDLFYDARFTTSDLGDRVDLTAVAKGFGVPAERVAVDEDPAEAIARMSAAAGPYMLEAMVDQNQYVYPIIPPGRSNVEMICGK
ncbi:MAG: acetolactate synthase, large subunit, biosynthetic type [Syntrophobacterales bacterium GWC2_56_13]|nr:MAG: acetolactate synthase, large subunit, biosynthetic type [Syntrophobacterales bacterium GWC2_56_13]